MASQANEVITLSGVVVVVLVNYLREHQAWGWMRLVQGPSSMKEAPGLVFAKVMGSGHGGGFGLRPSASHQGFIGLFDSLERAQAFLDGPYIDAARQRAAEHGQRRQVDPERRYPGDDPDHDQWQREPVGPAEQRNLRRNDDDQADEADEIGKNIEHVSYMCKTPRDCNPSD